MIKIDGAEYPDEVVEAFCEMEKHDGDCSVDTMKVLMEGPESWYRELMISHLNTFYQGWQAGYKAVKNWLEKHALRLGDRQYDSLKNILEAGLSESTPKAKTEVE